MSAWHWPQYAFAALQAIGLLVEANRHGRTRQTTGNLWTSLIALALCTGLLYAGGFW